MPFMPPQQMPPQAGAPMTAAGTMPIQTQQVATRPTASILTRKKKPTKTEPAADAKHWSQTKPSNASILARGKK